MHGALFEMRFAPDSEPDSYPFRSWWSRLVGKSGDSLAQKSFDTLDRGVRIIVHNMMFKRNRIGPFTVAANDVVMFLWVDGEQYSEREVSSMPRKPSYRTIEVMPAW